MSKEKMRICISSPPDREFLVAEIFVGDEQIAEINQETDNLVIEIYPRQSGELWAISFDQLIEVFKEGRKRLVGD